MLTAEVSLYPVETSESDDIIMDSLATLTNYNLQYDIGSLSTRISGHHDEVWRAIRTLYEQAQAIGKEIVMVVTVSNAN